MPNASDVAALQQSQGGNITFADNSGYDAGSKTAFSASGQVLGQNGQPTGSSFFGATATSPVVTTSDPATSVVTNTKNNIDNSAANPPTVPSTAPFGTINYDSNTDPNVQKNIDTQNQLYKDRETELQAQRDAEVARLTGESTQKQTELTNTQNAETGTSSRNLAYLQAGGTSASAQAYLVSLEASHRTEMSNLVAKYNASIQAAKNAYSDKDFELAKAMADNAQKIKDDAQKRNMDFLDYTLRLRTAANDEAKQNFQISTDARDYATKNGITQPFYELAGQLFRTADGSPINSAGDFLAAGGSKDYSNVFVVQPSDNKSYAGGDLGEYQFMVDHGQYNGTLLQFLAKKKQDAVDIAKAGSAGSGTKDYDLKVKQAPAQVQNLKDSGYNWGEISKYFISQGIDPGIPEIDDSLHRAFSNQTDYENWKRDNYNTAHGYTTTTPAPVSPSHP